MQVFAMKILASNSNLVTFGADGADSGRVLGFSLTRTGKKLETGSKSAPCAPLQNSQFFASFGGAEKTSGGKT
jgi:hypothetical protein